MLAHVDVLLGFVEEVERMGNYPEITGLDVAFFKFGNIDVLPNNPAHNGKYDPRLFDSLTNHVRKIFITDKEPVSLDQVHAVVSKRLAGSVDFKPLNDEYCRIKNYLRSNMNEVTRFSFSFPGSILEVTTVFDLLNNYFAATSQHSKPKAQSITHELNMLTFGSLTEMVRLMIIDLIKLVGKYVVLLKGFVSF